MIVKFVFKKISHRIERRNLRIVYRQDEANTFWIQVKESKHLIVRFALQM